MVARGPDDRPNLGTLSAPTLKPLRRMRDVSKVQLATDMAMSMRTFENFENGKSRLNVERIHEYAALLNVDPFAVLAAIEIRAPAFAAACADNKMMMIFMMQLEDFQATAGDLIARLDPLTLTQAFAAMFANLEEQGRKQAALISPPPRPPSDDSGPRPPDNPPITEVPDSEPE